MRIEFRVDGGLAAFPGLAKPVTIDCSALPKEEAAQLRGLVDRSGFFALDAGERQPAVPDARSYRITIDDGRRCHAVTIAEPIVVPALADLVAELRTRANAALKGKR